MKTISFESLKKKVKNSFVTGDLMFAYPGEYLFDRMCQHAGIQEKFGSLSRPENASRFKELVNECIDKTDVRCYKELLSYAKRVGVSLPKWLYGDCGIELTEEDGWVIYSVENKQLEQ